MLGGAVKSYHLTYPLVLLCSCNLNPQGELPSFDDEANSGAPGITGVTDEKDTSEGPRFSLDAGLTEDDFAGLDDTDTDSADEEGSADTDETADGDTGGQGVQAEPEPEEENDSTAERPPTGVADAGAQAPHVSDRDGGAPTFPESSDAGVPEPTPDASPGEPEPPQDAGADGGDAG